MIRLWCALVLLLLAGCAPYMTVYECETNDDGHPRATPCLGPCDLPMEQDGPVYTRVTVPYALVIRDQKGIFRCEEVEP